MPLISSNLPSADSTLGAVLIGGLISTALWGITCLQTYDFFMEKSKDRKNFKLLLEVDHGTNVDLRILDTIGAAMICHIVYNFTVSNHLSPTAAAYVTWTFWVHTLSSLFSTSLRGCIKSGDQKPVHSQNLLYESFQNTINNLDYDYLSFIICFCCQRSDRVHYPTWMDLNKNLFNIAALVFIAGAVSDTSVAIILSILLYKSKTKFSRTNSLLKTLILYTVNTSFVVVMDDIIIVITGFLMPNNLVFLDKVETQVLYSTVLAFYFCIQKREGPKFIPFIKLRNQTNIPTTIHLSDLRFTPENNSSTLPGHSMANQNFVEVSMEMVVDHDQKQ
ncbi:hypothetical protein K435DRAFT_792825 [Dendrothele bispora CBS 962.96]|uniref:Uncharacterized protein n=1 Tax=Dendrothele bispora (strain CBS 962.96) TaxID=1314807 RepID=A0A4S8MH68_DENBC|nr:hypothetical protein K435DRAFT_792825 [Dendrothele bispora CBS 962.96]